MARVICLGDSITFGEYDEVGGGWVDRMKRDCMRAYVCERSAEVTVLNCGIGGERTTGLRARFEVELTARLDPDEPNVVLLAYGMNDLAVRPDRPRIPPSDFRENLRHVLASIGLRGTRPALVNITPIAARLDGSPNANGTLRSRAAIDEYNLVLAELANEQAVPLIDAHTAMQPTPELFLAEDGVHPNALGHEAIARVVQAAVDRLVR
jgi:lysophospholipase L1-like esterase